MNCHELFLDRVSVHVRLASAAMADCTANLMSNRHDVVAEVAALLATAEARLNGLRSSAGFRETSEDDAQAERRAEWAAAEVRRYLAGLGLNAAETDFAIDEGERAAEQVIDAYRVAVAAHPALNPAVVLAALTVASAIVHDRPDPA